MTCTALIFFCRLLIINGHPHTQSSSPMSARLAKLLENAIIRSGTQHCGCLRLHEVVLELERLQVSDKQLDDIVKLTLISGILETKKPLDIGDLCLNTERFRRGIKLWKDTRDPMY